ncbi:MAG: ABC transporter substrate-binding protein [Lachnospiraceae bacterium]|nr:ABC transporter substrate-binding protein [Lachnospiraceae bacterium]
MIERRKAGRKIKKKVLALTLAAALAVSALAGCGGGKKEGESPETKVAGAEKEDEVRAPAEDGEEKGETGTSVEGGQGKNVIKLGGLAPLTGNDQEYGQGFEIGFKKAIEEINAAGGVNGYTFDIEIKDTQSNEVTSSTIATAFAEDEAVMALLGDFSSGVCKANAQVCDRYGIVQLSPTAAAFDYAPMSKYFFSIMGRQDAEAFFLAKYVLKEYLGAQKIAVAYVDSDWGRFCFGNFKTQADKEGLEVSAETYGADEKDFNPLITKLQAEKADAFVVMDPGDLVADIFNQADAAGWQIKHVALGPGTSQQVVNSLSDKNNLMVASSFFIDPENAELTAWAEWFEGEAGFAPTIHPACAYDSVYLIAEAVKNIDGEVTRDSIREALLNLPEYQGITGSIKFEADGDIRRNYMICAVKGGEWEILEGFEYGADGY